MSPDSLVTRTPTDTRFYLSPLVSVRWSGGNLLIVTPSLTTISAFDARILEVLDAFARPRTIADASADLRDIPPSLLAICLAVLTEHRVLIQSDGPDDLAGAGARNQNSASSLAASIATLARTIARDARAMAPYLEQSRGSSRAVDVDSRLEQVRDVLIGLAADLRRSRPEHLRQQLSTLKLPDGEPIRLHLGCGASRLAGWINVDYPPADLAVDLGWPLSFEDGSVQYVYLGHVLEHLEYPVEARAFLEEVHRVLAPGGVLRVVVPDVEKCIRAYAAVEKAFFERRGDFWPEASRCETRLEHFLHYAGAGVRPEVFWGHKYGYDFETLRLLLTRSGFPQIDRSQYMRSEHAALRVDSASAAAGYRYGATHYSLFVEATR